jgi:hypothetical protein
MTVASSLKSAIRPLYSAIVSQPVVAEMRKSRPVFNRQRKRYFANHPIQTNKAPKDPALAELLANGIVVLPQYFDGARIKAIHDKALAAAKLVREGAAPDDWSTLAYSSDGIYRLRNVSEVIPESQMIVDDQRLLDITHEYLGYPIRGRANYLDYKPDFGKHDDTTMPHMDSWMSQIKIFTLLNDVDPLSAPLVYWKRSHFDREWRREIDYQHFKASYFGSAGLCPPHVLREMSGEKTSDFEKITATGSAGTVVIADVRGFHRASNVFAGYRLEVAQKFTIQMPR